MSKTAVRSQGKSRKVSYLNPLLAATVGWLRWITARVNLMNDFKLQTRCYSIESRRHNWLWLQFLEKVRESAWKLMHLLCDLHNFLHWRDNAKDLTVSRDASPKHANRLHVNINSMQTKPRRWLWLVLDDFMAFKRVFKSRSSLLTKSSQHDSLLYVTIPYTNEQFTYQRHNLSDKKHPLRSGSCSRLVLLFL